MADLKRLGRNNQKKANCVVVFEVSGQDLIDASATAEASTLGTLPMEVMVNRVTLISKMGGGKVTVVVNGVAAISDFDLGTNLVAERDALPTYLATGGPITMVPESVASTSEFMVVVEFVELEKVTGEYIN